MADIHPSASCTTMNSEDHDHLHMPIGRLHHLHSDDHHSASQHHLLAPSTRSSMTFMHPLKPEPEPAAASGATSSTLEVGVTECLQKHVAHQLPPYKSVSQTRLDFEARRPHWLRECVAEATGVFFFAFPGLASIAALTVNADAANGTAAHSSTFQVGWGMGLGVAFAIITCAPTSGGHFNPAVTLAMAMWQGFPWRKVPRYIIAQIIGAFVAGLMIMALYWTQIQELTAAYTAAGKSLVSHGGPASILVSTPHDDQTNMGYVFMVEFFVDAFIGMVIWAALDPANPFMSPQAVPFVIGLAYADMIWGFGGITLSTNLARDLGPRIVAAIFYGPGAFTWKGYAPIGMLVNIPATLAATCFYEAFLRDSLMVIGKGHAQHVGGESALYEHMRKINMVDEEQGVTVKA